jgi:excinuclease UvrABC nuclease subunit
VKDPYPKVLITRRENDGKSRYFGPFDSMKSVETLVKQIRRIVPFCTQKTIHKGACFYHKIGLCDPCPNIVEHDTEPEKTRDKKRYRAQITTIVRVLDGKTDLVFRSLRKEIRDLTDTQHYEEAMKRRDAMRQLELLIMHGSFIDGNIHLYNRSEQALAALQTILKPYYPSLSDLHRIECYDNSTLSFQNSTASMVVFTDGMVDKKEYRRFKLRTKPNNDFDMMKEVITRRLKNTRWPAPDLIIIDGGKPQVRAVQKILNSNLQFSPSAGQAISKNQKEQKLIKNWNLNIENLPIIGLLPHYGLRSRSTDLFLTSTKLALQPCLGNLPDHYANLKLNHLHLWRVSLEQLAEKDLKCHRQTWKQLKVQFFYFYP